MSKRHGFAGLFLLFLGLCVVLAASCATTPRVAEKEMTPESRLPSGAIAYGFANAPHLKTVIQDVYPDLMGDKNAAQFVDKCDYAVFGVYQDAADGEKPASQNYFLITRGTYPASSYNFALGLSPNWKKVTIDGKKWWRQGTVALSIEKNEAYIQIGRTPDQTTPAAPNEEFGVFFADARREREAGTPPAFACYVPSSETAGLIRRLGIPFDITLQHITLTVSPDSQAAPYRSTLSLKTRSPSEAKALSAILSLARATIGKRIPPNAANALLTELLFANPPALDSGGSTVIISGTFPLNALIPALKRP
ncbi:MAG: hypothetical protein LBT00_13880 [Spirochaetaceae bacterium]|jgi:hypothetical protein|nr:hypothetical protein [Spirochaetaceae bacterium]